MASRSLTFATLWLGLTAVSATAFANSSPQHAYPAWVTKLTSAESKSSKPYNVQEVTYNGLRAFEVNQLSHFSADNDHVLYAEDGTKICAFGGQVEHVTEGACDPEKIVSIGDPL